MNFGQGLIFDQLHALKTKCEQNSSKYRLVTLKDTNKVSLRRQQIASSTTSKYEHRIASSTRTGCPKNRVTKLNPK